MRRISAGAACAAIVVAVAAVGLPDAVAGELIRFIDGRYLEVADHRVHGDYVSITLEPGAIVVFEVDRVEWIERSGRRVYGPDVEDGVKLARRLEPADAETRPRRERDPAEPVVRRVASDFLGHPVRAVGATRR